MVDIVDKTTRSRMMACICAKDTRPEVVIRKKLYSRGFRYRKNVKSLPGTPDIVLKKYDAVIQIHGCFWHGHDCDDFKWPATRPVFWKNKILNNQKRDRLSAQRLLGAGWKLLIVWECAVKKATKGKDDNNLQELVDTISSWIMSDEKGIKHIGGSKLAK
ncbi:DNA mismatch endonuclease Vsr [uncultured Desulfuromusa sp.]|uniref:very short patch repair endonuclease n=1 Tax=uncultured Desulfuromusa sp. TaxID=219183 RepID=UPI002AA8BE27|nr:DNA mismatch endonuclease Vsr [uncultured Desulfuromusa sp.]